MTIDLVERAVNAVVVTEQTRREAPSLGALAWVVGRDVNWTIGGGVPTIEALRRALGRRGWITDVEHQQLFAASRVTPGTNLLAYCTAVGWHVRGLPGAIVALLAASVPCAIVSAVVMAMYGWLDASPTFAIVVAVGMTIALVLLFAGAWQLARPHLTRVNATRVMAILGVAIALQLAGVSPVWVLLVAALVGAIWPAAERHA